MPVILQRVGLADQPLELPPDLEPAKFAILRIFGENLDFGYFVKFEILNPSENQNLKSLTLTPNLHLDNKISNFL